MTPHRDVDPRLAVLRRPRPTASFDPDARTGGRVDAGRVNGGNSPADTQMAPLANLWVALALRQASERRSTGVAERRVASSTARIGSPERSAHRAREGTNVLASGKVACSPSSPRSLRCRRPALREPFRAAPCGSGRLRALSCPSLRASVARGRGRCRGCLRRGLEARVTLPRAAKDGTRSRPHAAFAA